MQNGRKRADGLLLTGSVGWEREYLVGKAVLGSSCSSLFCRTDCFCVTSVLLLQKQREKLPYGNGQLLHTGSYSIFLPNYGNTGELVCSGAAANMFCCHISVISKEEQDQKGP